MKFAPKDEKGSLASLRLKRRSNESEGIQDRVIIVLIVLITLILRIFTKLRSYYESTHKLAHRLMLL